MNDVAGAFQLNEFVDVAENHGIIKINSVIGVWTECARAPARDRIQQYRARWLERW